jgi:hypothetical protein
MPLPNIFLPEIAEQVIQRIQQLAPDSKPIWGKMTVEEMLAHCNVSYEMVYEDKHPRPSLLMGFILKALVKKVVTSETPYKHNLRTAPQFMIKDRREFEKEKGRLINHIIRTLELGETHFDNKKSHSLGRLTKTEWNNLFYKHLDHHLGQFGV